MINFLQYLNESMSFSLDDCKYYSTNLNKGLGIVAKVYIRKDALGNKNEISKEEYDEALEKRKLVRYREKYGEGKTPKHHSPDVLERQRIRTLQTKSEKKDLMKAFMMDNIEQMNRMKKEEREQIVKSLSKEQTKAMEERLQTIKVARKQEDKVRKQSISRLNSFIQ